MNFVTLDGYLRVLMEKEYVLDEHQAALVWVIDRSVSGGDGPNAHCLRDN